MWVQIQLGSIGVEQHHLLSPCVVDGIDSLPAHLNFNINSIPIINQNTHLIFKIRYQYHDHGEEVPSITMKPILVKNSYELGDQS